MSAADLILGATLRTDEMRVCVHPELVDQHERLQVDLRAAADRDADSFAGGAVAAKQAEIDALLEVMAEHTVTLVLQALPRPKYRALIDEHPPRQDEQGNVKAVDARYGVNYDTFYNALARLSIVGARVDEETVEKLDDHVVDVLIDEKLSDAQWEDLTSRCHNLNRTRVDIPFSPAGSPRTRRSSPS